MRGMATDLIKHPDETIIWEGKPEWKPYLINGLLTFGKTTIWLTFFWVLFIVIRKINGDNLNWIGMYLFTFVVIGVISLRLVRRTTSYRNAYYYLTNQKIYIYGGAIDRRLTVFDRKKIILVDIEVSKVDKKFNAGTILLHFGEIELVDNEEKKVFQKIESIKDPESIIRLLP